MFPLRRNIKSYEIFKREGTCLLLSEINLQKNLNYHNQIQNTKLKPNKLSATLTTSSTSATPNQFCIKATKTIPHQYNHSHKTCSTFYAKKILNDFSLITSTYSLSFQNFGLLFVSLLMFVIFVVIL